MPFATGNNRWSVRPRDDEDEKYDTERVARQIENAKLRLSDAGVNVGADTDKRNWFEKATNLPEGQNWFFDALELIGRPSQAVLNVVDKNEEGNPLRAAWRGLSGQDRVRGSEIVRDMGVDNRALQAVLGTGLEIVADPLTYIPGAQIAKAASVTGRGIKGAATGAYRAAERVSPRFAQISESRLRPAAQAISDGLGYAFNRNHKIDETLEGGSDPFLRDLTQETENTRRFMQEESIKGITQAAKNAGGLESGVDVGRIMEAPLRQFEDVRMYELPDGMRRTTSKRELENEIIGNKQRVKELGSSIRESNRELDRAISQAATKLEQIDKQIRRSFFSKENAALRQLNKRKNKPVNLNELAEKKAFALTGASPTFNLLLKMRDETKNQLDQLRLARKESGSSEIANISKLNQENEAIRESMGNPVMVQREIPRPERELNAKPEVKEAAMYLMRTNNDLRQYARENGIHIDEMEGYMRHILSKSERELRAKGRISRVDQGSFNTGGPSKRILDQRKLTGSAEDVNEQLQREFFEPNAFFATAIGQKQLIDYIQAVQFRRKVLSNPEFARKYKKGDVIGPNQVVIDTNKYKFIKEGDDIPEVQGLANEVGGEYIVTKAVKNALDRYQQLTTDEGTKAFLRAYDGVLNNWKKLALLSPLYHVRNMAGAMFNNYVGGMNTPQLIKYTTEGLQEVAQAMRGNESKLFNEYRRQGLGAQSMSNVEFLRSTDPEEQVRKMVKRKTATGAQALKGKLNLTETSREVGDIIDQANRFALYKFSRNRGMTPEQAAQKVREVQFDYTNTTATESGIAARVIPFYRWMRFNIPFQLKQLISDPKKYANVNKIRLNAQETAGLEEETMPDYMKEQFALPVWGNPETGTGKVLGLNLPLGDLTRVSNPLKLVTDAIASPLKLPLELGLNRNFFFDDQIQDFAGQQTRYDLPGKALDFGINPRLAYTIEQLGGQPARLASNMFKSNEDEDQARRFTEAAMGISVPLKDYDVNRFEYFKLLDDLKKLQDYIKYVEQQTGREVRSVNEIR